MSNFGGPWGPIERPPYSSKYMDFHEIGRDETAPRPSKLPLSATPVSCPHPPPRPPFPRTGCLHYLIMENLAVVSMTICSHYDQRNTEKEGSLGVHVNKHLRVSVTLLLLEAPKFSNVSCDCNERSKMKRGWWCSAVRLDIRHI